jgi:hypothetical protein
MIVRRLLTGVLLGGLAFAPAAAAEPEASPAPAASTAPATAESDRPLPPPVASVPSPEIAARARAEFEANKNGKIDRARYTSEMNARITDGALAEVSSTLRSLGTVKTFTQVRKITNGSLTLYVFRVECEKPPLIEVAIGWDPTGKVDYLQLGPAR